MSNPITTCLIFLFIALSVYFLSPIIGSAETEKLLYDITIIYRDTDGERGQMGKVVTLVGGGRKGTEISKENAKCDHVSRPSGSFQCEIPCDEQDRFNTIWKLVYENTRLIDGPSQTVMIQTGCSRHPNNPGVLFSRVGEDASTEKQETPISENAEIYIRFPGDRKVIIDGYENDRQRTNQVISLEHGQHFVEIEGLNKSCLIVTLRKDPPYPNQHVFVVSFPAPQIDGVLIKNCEQAGS